MEQSLQQSNNNLGILNRLIIDNELQALNYDRPILSAKDLVDTFPQAKSVVKQMIKDDEDILESHSEMRQGIRNRLSRTLPIHQVGIASEIVFTLARTDYLENNTGGMLLKNGKPQYIQERMERNKKFMSLWNKPKNDADFKEKLARAKEFPISSLIKIEHNGTAKCPLHKERTGSFKLYKNNTFYCFGCQAGGDSIYLYQKLNDCSFKEAVEKLQ